MSTLNSLDGRVKANSAIIPAGLQDGVSVFATDDTEVILDLTGYFVNSGGLDFFPTQPLPRRRHPQRHWTLRRPRLSNSGNRRQEVRSASTGPARCT